MSEDQLREVDEGYLLDLALAEVQPRRRKSGARRDHPVLHLLQHPEARPEPDSSASRSVREQTRQ